jgi:cytochrome c biogenesis protein CcdA
VFYLGLTAVLIPLGMGSALASTIAYGHQAAVSLTAGVLLIALGVVQIVKGGFAIPGLARLRRSVKGTSVLAVLVLGAVSGLAGFCAGPILGAVLTVAAASGSPLLGGSLLAVYAAGMTTPLLVISAAWSRYGTRRLRWLRGREVRLGRFRLHTSSALAGLLMIGMGAVFLRYQGIGGLSGLLSPPGLTGWNARLQTAMSAVQARVPDLWLLASLAAAVLAGGLWRLRRLRRDPPGPERAGDSAGASEQTPPPSDADSAIPPQPDKATVASRQEEDDM